MPKEITEELEELCVESERCPNCGSTTGEAIEIGGKSACTICASRCQDCDEWVLKGDLNLVDVYGDLRSVCDSCFDNYRTCDDCGYATTGGLTETAGGTHVCDDCLENHYYYCEGCDTRTYSDNYDSDRELCHNCIEEEARRNGFSSDASNTSIELFSSSDSIRIGSVTRHTEVDKIQHLIPSCSSEDMLSEVYDYLKGFYRGSTVAEQYIWNPRHMYDYSTEVSIFDNRQSELIDSIKQYIGWISEIDFSVIKSSVYKYEGITIVDLKDGLLYYKMNPKKIKEEFKEQIKQISVFKFIEYTTKFFKEFEIALNKYCNDNNLNYSMDTDIYDTIDAFKKSVESQNKYTLRMSNMQDIKLQLWEQSYAMNKTCQCPSNIDSYAKGFHDLFSNGCNGILILYNSSNKPVARMLTRLFYPVQGERTQPYLFLERIYTVDGNHKWKLLQEISLALMDKFDVIVNDRSAHDVSNYELLSERSDIVLSRLSTSFLIQPYREITWNDRTYYKDSRVVSAIIEGRKVTDVLSGDIYLLNKPE